MLTHDLGLAPLLDALFERGASDLVLSVGAAPALRIDGRLERVGDQPLQPKDAERLVDELLTDPLRATFTSMGAVDFSFDWSSLGRVRGNAFRQRGSVALALRAIPYHIPSFADLGVPPVVERLVELPQGLILVSGPTGSGKSTTQAAMLDAINRNAAKHIITIEDPIEYVHRHQRSLVQQREVGIDTPGFPEALRSSLREDPDVLLVGEMRDLESIRMTLTIAETGHLVIGTLHTNDTAQAINRIVDVFPGEQQQQIRVQLSSALAAVLYQQLLPRVGGGRVAAFEVLIATYPVRNLIHENKGSQIRNVIATSAREGMQTLEASLSSLVRQGFVDHREAMARSMFPAEVRAAG
jgi:twitching motility protein PilT